jgi:hypothetical protein
MSLRPITQVLISWCYELFESTPEFYCQIEVLPQLDTVGELLHRAQTEYDLAVLAGRNAGFANGIKLRENPKRTAKPAVNSGLRRT